MAGFRMRSIIIRPHFGDNSGYCTVALYNMGYPVSVQAFTSHAEARSYAECLRIGRDTMDCRVNDKLPVEGSI